MKMYGKNFKKQWTKAFDMRTICEVLREIFWQTQDPVVREKVMEATAMAKKMDKKLRAYAREKNETWDEDMWEAIDDREQREKYRMEQCIREQEEADK